ncbi:MAG: endo-1,4-beta-xylanase [Clostridiales bacterium]|jgi:endo-1,4-beta-xylanase|nr:endo-1,4-beta-xylanase [Clostridiales bacterium]
MKNMKKRISVLLVILITAAVFGCESQSIYSVTVVGGSADKKTAAAGSTVTLTSDAPVGKEFYYWQPDKSDVTVTDGGEFTMPARNVTVTAVFSTKQYTVTVEGGSYNGLPIYGQAITLTPTYPETFLDWEVLGGGIVITDNSFTMPAADVSIAAVYSEPLPQYDVTVTGGTASPSKAVAGTLITLTAEPPYGEQLVQWNVISGGVVIEDETFIMPENDVEVEAEFETIPHDTSLLRYAYEDYFPVGAAVQPSEITAYKNAGLLQHFGSLTAENHMKWNSLQSTQGTFTWSNADSIVAAAKLNDSVVRGHALVWYNALPSWVLANGTTKEEAITRMKTHIDTVVKHFDSTVYCWDVVNEAILDTPTNNQITNNTFYRTTGWYDVCGADYIAEAFKAARAANANVKLFYNDYNMIYATHRNAVVKMVQGLQTASVPIDGIGMQSHFNIWDFSATAFEQSVQTFINLGLDVQVTELDMSLYKSTETSSLVLSGDELTSRLATQAAQYAEIFRIARKYAGDNGAGKGQFTGITFWGVADDHTWLPSGSSPLLWYKNFAAKPALAAILNF